MTRVILLWAGAIIAFYLILLVFAPGLFWQPWVMLGVLIVGSLLVGGAAYYTLGAQRLRAAARILGFVGGAMCLVPAMFLGVQIVLGFFLKLRDFLLGSSGEFYFLAIATIVPVMAIRGAGLALKKPKAAGILMLASGILAWAPICMTWFLGWGFGLYTHNDAISGLSGPLLLGLYYIFASFFLIAGGIFALIAREK